MRTNLASSRGKFRRETLRRLRAKLRLSFVGGTIYRHPVGGSFIEGDVLSSSREDGKRVCPVELCSECSWQNTWLNGVFAPPATDGRRLFRA